MAKQAKYEVELPDARWLSNRAPVCGECGEPLVDLFGRSLVVWVASQGGAAEPDNIDVQHALSWGNCANGHTTELE